LSGNAVVGQVFTVSPGTWTGSPAPTFTYQWQRCDNTGANCVPINGQTATTYTVASADIGSTLVAVVTGTNSSGQASAPTAATAVVGSAPANTVAPTLSGNAAVGQVLTVAPGTWTGSPAPTLTYQWQRCDNTGANCVPINGQTATTYTVASADIGSTLVAVVTGTNTHGQASAPTAASAVVPGTGSAPANTVTPTLSGNAVVGQVLTVSPGTWTGSPAPTFTYQWQRCDNTGANCVPINGQTATTYTVTSTDIGSTLVAVVTGTNTHGQASAPTAASAVVPGSLAPTTPVLDNFNRANGGAGSNWSNIRPTTGFAAMNISSNAAVDSSTTAFAWNYWNPATYGPNAEAYVTIRTYGAGDVIRIGARVTGGTTAYSGYYVSISSTGAWSIIRIDNGGSPITLASGATQTLASGDAIAIRIIGTVITALHYTTATGWTQVLSYDTAADATRYTNPGSLALEFKTSTLDDFGGGTLP
jgi:ribosomal protein L14